jgi:hypothetical protein
MKLPYISKIVFNKNKSSKGFRLINCLAIFGILAGNTSPVLSQTTVDPTSEAKQFVGTMLQAEQSFYLNNGYYTTRIPELGTGLPTQTVYYRYIATLYNYPNNDPSIPGVTITTRLTNNPGVTAPGSLARAVVGGVAMYTVGGYATTVSKICTAIVPYSQGGKNGGDLIIFSSTGLICPPGYK